MQLARLIPTKSSWMAAHFWGVLMPFFTVTALRLIFSPSLMSVVRLEFFEAGDLALSLGLAGMFARGSIARADTIINDEEMAEKKRTAALWAENLGYVFLFMFAGHKLLDQFVDKLAYQVFADGRFVAQILVLVTAFFMYILMKYSQEAFRLKADI